MCITLYEITLNKCSAEVAELDNQNTKKRRLFCHCKPFLFTHSRKYPPRRSKARYNRKPRRPHGQRARRRSSAGRRGRPSRRTAAAPAGQRAQAAPLAIGPAGAAGKSWTAGTICSGSGPGELDKLTSGDGGGPRWTTEGTTAAPAARKQEQRQRRRRQIFQCWTIGAS